MLSHENISQRIFEYHEGTLDASQESELMDYLHQYPELNHEFAVWAQARLHDEPVEKPVFYKKLLKEKPFYFNWPVITRFTFEIVTLCSLVLLLSNKPNYNNENKTSKPEGIEKKIAPGTISDQVIEKEKDNNQTTNQSFKTIKRKSEPKWITETLVPIKVDQDSLPINAELSTAPLISPKTIEPEILLYEPTAKEPMVTAMKIEKVKPAVKKVNRKKYYPKQKFSLRPTSKIVPQNKDF